MSETGEVRTRYLVLRKTDYSETSLVVGGISPDVGQVSFLARGVRRLGRRQFPVVDLFRVLEVVYRPGRAELQTWRAVTLAQDFAGLGRRYDAFCAAAWLGRFALANVMPGVSPPRFFNALLCSLRRLLETDSGRVAGPGWLTAARLGPALVFLDESGLLPDYAAHSEAATQTRTLLDMAVGELPVPVLTEATWQRLWDWLLPLLRQGECRLPEPDTATRFP